MPRIWTNIQIEQESKELFGFLRQLNISRILRNDSSLLHCLLNHFWKNKVMTPGRQESMSCNFAGSNICIWIQIAYQHFQSFQYWYSMFCHFCMYLFSSLLNILLVFVFVFVTFKRSAGLHTVDSCCPHMPYCFPENVKNWKY